MLNLFTKKNVLHLVGPYLKTVNYSYFPLYSYRPFRKYNLLTGFILSTCKTYLQSGTKPVLQHSIKSFYSLGLYNTQLVSDPLIYQLKQNFWRHWCFAMSPLVSFSPHGVDRDLKCISDAKSLPFFSMGEPTIRLEIVSQVLTNELRRILWVRCFYI